MRSAAGSRHPLLTYRRTVDRVWKYTLVLSMVLAAASRWSLIRKSGFLGISSDVWLLTSALIAATICVLAFSGRYFAYVQAGTSFLKISTPFLTFKVAYRRMRSIHPVLIQQLFPPEELSWSQRTFLEPFYGKTVLVVELRGFPLNPILMRLFLPQAMFSPRSSGLVLIVPDWMKLSMELDSLHGAWLQKENTRLRLARAQH